MVFPQGLALLVGLGLLSGQVQARAWRQLPIAAGSSKSILSSNFIGESTTDFAIAMLQEKVSSEDANYVFSPVGYATILAILAEGAREATRSQLAASLHHPEDTSALREAYKALLNRMKEKSETGPEFKNWFYVYKNYTVKDNYRSILSDYYLTDVKSVEWDYYELENEKNENEKNENENKVEQDEPDVKVVLDEGGKYETEKPIDAEKQTTEVSKDSDNSVTEVVTEEIKQQEDDETAQEVTTETNNDESTTEQEIDTSENETIEKGKEKRRYGARYFVNRDTVTALTANRLTSHMPGQNKDKIRKKIIIFNGFYYRGNWTVPFSVPTEEKDEFFVTPEEKKAVTMMHTEGEFEFGHIPDIQACAVEIPYVGEKYSLLILLPNADSNLTNLAESLEGYSFPKIDSYLEKKSIHICIPKVNFYTISKPRQALEKKGVKDIFSKEADLSGINSDKELYLDELVQLVTMHFEETTTTTNFMTSSLVHSRNNPTQFKANRPFFFFLRDRQDGVILAAGKVQDPSKSDNSK